MTKMKKIVTAGQLVKEVIYPLPTRQADPLIRAGKKKISSAAQQRMNAKYSWQKCELMLAANFPPGSIVCAMTYDDRHKPRNRKEAMQQLEYFRTKLKHSRKERGAELKMLWNEESLTSSGRRHHHCVINVTSGDDYAEILKCWGQGEVEFQKLKIDGANNGYEALARYLTKEYAEKPGQRAWSYTRNLQKPDVESFRVPDDTPLDVPRGGTLLDKASERTQYGAYTYIKYIYQSKHTPSRSKTKSRRAFY